MIYIFLDLLIVNVAIGFVPLKTNVPQSLSVNELKDEFDDPVTTPFENVLRILNYKYIQI